MDRRPYGRLWLDRDVIRHAWPGGEFEVLLDDVRVIGEYTNQDGPGGNDWCICFIADDQGWYDAPVYADGFNAFKDELGAKLGAPLVPELASSADFASRILWPSHLVGQRAFEFTVSPGTSTWQRLVRLAFPIVDQRLSEQVLAELRPCVSNVRANVNIADTG